MKRYIIGYISATNEVLEQVEVDAINARTAILKAFLHTSETTAPIEAIAEVVISEKKVIPE